MKKFTKILPIAFAAFALASCSSDDLFSNGPKEATQAGENQMIAEVEDVPEAITRYGLDNGSTMFVWSTGDTYTVYDQTLTKYSEFDLDPAYSGSKAGLFAVKEGQQDIVDAEGNSTARYGVFPYHAENEISLKNHKATLYMPLPGTLAYSAITGGEKSDLPEDGGSVAALPLWGSVKNVSGSRKITFKMMTAMLKVDLSEIPAELSQNVAPFAPAYIKIASKAHKLSGAFMADITDQTVAEYSGDVADVELVANGAPANATEKEIKVTFSTGGEKINRVFYVPIPVGTYEAGDLTVVLGDFNGTEVDLTPDTWTADAVTFTRGKAKKITYTLMKDVTANTIQGINNAIYNELVIANSKSPIQEGQTFTFNIDGAKLTPGAAATAGTDNMLLIPTFEDKNINVILNIANAIDLSTNALYIAEAKYGTKSGSVDNLYHTNKAANADDVIADVAASKRAFVVNFGANFGMGTVGTGVITAGNVNILAPTSTVIVNNTKAADQGFTNVAATVATGDNTFQIGMFGTNATEVGTDLTVYAGGLYVGEFAAVTNTKVKSNDNVNVFGNAGTITKEGTGALVGDATATIAALTNTATGTGAVTLNGAVTGNVANAANATVVLNGAVGGTVTNTGANANITINAAVTGAVATNSAQPLVLTKTAVLTSNLTSTGSGELQIHGTVTGAINNNGTAAITVSQDHAVGGNDRPSVGTINQGAQGGAINVSASSNAVTVNNNSKSSDIVIDYQYIAADNSTKKDAALAATITDNDEVMTNAATGSITVKNTSGQLTITNLGGNVTLENCADHATTPVSVIDINTKTNPEITLNNSYVKTINNLGSKKVTIHTSKKAGIEGVSTGALYGDFTIDDAGWATYTTGGNTFGYSEPRNNGKIYTAAQLAGLQTACAGNSYTLEADLNMSAGDKLWTGITPTGDDVVFNGQDFTITGLSFKQQNTNGLFKQVTKKFTVKNLTLANFSLAKKNGNHFSNVAALIGAATPAAAANTLTIQNVTVTGASLDANEGSAVAALVGSFVSAAAADLTISGCDVSGTSALKAKSYLAAFVGQLGLAKDVTISSSSIENTTLTVNGNPNKAAGAGTTAYVIGGVSGAVTSLTINTNCSVDPEELTNDQRIAWKYKNNADNDGKFFWGAANGFVGYLNGGAITTYNIGTTAQAAGDDGQYNIYKGY